MQCLYAYTYMFFMPEYSSMVSAAVKKNTDQKKLGVRKGLSDSSVIQGSQGKNSSQEPEGRNEAETMSKAASYITQDYLPRHGAYHSPAWPFHFNYKTKKMSHSHVHRPILCGQPRYPLPR